MCDKINWATPIVLDFETYYDKGYTLKGKKYTTEEYIRCAKFECMGLSIKIGNADTLFYRGEDWLGDLEVILAQHPDSPVVSHNNMFDMGILGLRYDIHPDFMVDTVVMAKLCGLDRVAGGASLAKLIQFLSSVGVCDAQKGTAVRDMVGIQKDAMSEAQWQAYEAYCKLDGDLGYILYTYMLPFMQISELVMADITTKMWTRPAIDIDVPLLEAYAIQLETNKDTALTPVADRLGMDVEGLMSTLRSPKKFPEQLARLGVTVPTKWSEKKQKAIPATAKTDVDFLALQDHPDELVALLVAAKLGHLGNQEQTRTATFLNVASRGSMPVPLVYSAAHTGRYGGTDKLNFQNLSKRTKEPVLRRSLRPKQGYVWVCADSSQIECRLNMYQANQTDVVQVFLDGRCVYVDMATKVYNESYEELYKHSKTEHTTKEGKTKRNVGKALVLGCGYGMGEERFAGELEKQGLVDMIPEAGKLVRTYRNTNAMVKYFWKECERALDAMYAGGEYSFGGPDNNLYFASGSTTFHGVTIPSIKLPNGAYIWYQNLRKEPDPETNRVGYVYDQFKGFNWVAKRIWGSSLCENVTQALAFVVLKWQAIEIAKAGLPINLNVHDEWASVVPKQQAAEAADIYYTCMKRVPDYLPQGLLNCEVDVGMNYADLRTIDMEKYYAD